MVINTSFRLTPWADALYACDEAWWKLYFREVAPIFQGELWSVSQAAAQRFGLNWIHGHSKLGGLSNDPNMIHCGKNSGFQAISLVYLFGVERIILLGFDFMHAQREGKRIVHWHGDHPKGLGNAAAANLGKWAREMHLLADDLKQTTTQVINASRRTALKCFRRMNLEDALQCM